MTLIRRKTTADRPRQLVFRGNVCWYADKAHRLRQARRPSFAAVLEALATRPGALKRTMAHPAAQHAGKWLWHVRLSNGGLVAVPFQVLSNGRLLLRTVYPDRRLRKLYGDQ